MRGSIAPILLFAASTASAETKMDDLVGSWTCDGYFVKSGKKLAATISVSRDDATTALIVRHDDRAPGAYHALEVWSGSGTSLRAAISDSSGQRWYASTGWASGALTWARNEGEKVIETFVYRLGSDHALTVEWSHVVDNALTLGDRITCHKQ